MNAPTGIAVVFLLFIAFCLGGFFESRKMLDTPIESKTPIEPDLVIVVSGGELDTTFVYKRN